MNTPKQGKIEVSPTQIRRARLSDLIAASGKKDSTISKMIYDNEIKSNVETKLVDESMAGISDTSEKLKKVKEDETQKKVTEQTNEISGIRSAILNKADEIKWVLNPIDIAQKLISGNVKESEMSGKIYGKNLNLIYFFTNSKDEQRGFANKTDLMRDIPRSEYRRLPSTPSSGGPSRLMPNIEAINVLTEMLDFMRTTREEDQRENMIRDTFLEQQEQQVEGRHKEVISAILAISKNKRKADTHIKKEVEKTSKEAEKQTQKSEEQTKETVNVGKKAEPIKAPEPAKPAEPAKKEIAKEPVKPIEPQPPSVTPKEVPVEKAPKPRIKLKSKPTAEPVSAAPTPPTTTPIPPTAAPSAKPIIKPKIPSAAATATKITTITGAALGTGLVPLLARAESGSYNQLVHPIGGKKSGKPSTAPLTEMSIKQVREYQKTKLGKANGYPSDAVGKYQIIGSTLESAIKELNLNTSLPFDEDMQNYIFTEFLIKRKKGREAIENYISGKSNDITAAQLALAKEFASIGVPERVYRKEARNKEGKLLWGARWIEKGESYYIGVGGNKASVSPEQSAKALSDERTGRLSSQSASLSSESQTLANKLLDSSVQVQSQKNELQKQTPPIVQLNQTNNSVNVNRIEKTVVGTKPETKPIFEAK